MKYTQILLSIPALVLLGLTPSGFAAPANAPQTKVASPAKSTAVKPKEATPPDTVASDSDEDTARDQGTLEVTSDHDLEWLQQDHAYVARGNAVAKRGAVTLMADTLIAYYRPLAGSNHPAPVPAPGQKPGKPAQSGFDTGNTEIWRVIADGHVHIVSEERDAFGDHADYDKDKSVIVLTGHDLKATTLTETVTARDSLEYWQDPLDMAVARGNALLVKVNGNKLAGDVIGGHFVKNAQGQTVLKTIESKGNVVITTRSDIVHGDEGTYDLDTERTVVFGNVRATRGASELEGASAEVNMKTGISQVFPEPGQRVRGLFVRSSNPAAAASSPSQPGGKP